MQVVLALDLRFDLGVEVGWQLARLLLTQAVEPTPELMDAVGEGVEAQRSADVDVPKAAGIVAQRDVARALAAVRGRLLVGAKEEPDRGEERADKSETRGEPSCAAGDDRQARTR